jgi:hypothetical protein
MNATHYASDTYQAFFFRGYYQDVCYREPKYVHDCDACLFLGQVFAEGRTMDCYVHQTEDTVILRYGNEDHENYSFAREIVMQITEGRWNAAADLLAFVARNAHVEPRSYASLAREKAERQRQQAERTEREAREKAEKAAARKASRTTVEGVIENIEGQYSYFGRRATWVDTMRVRSSDGRIFYCTVPASCSAAKTGDVIRFDASVEEKTSTRTGKVYYKCTRPTKAEIVISKAA